VASCKCSQTLFRALRHRSANEVDRGSAAAIEQRVSSDGRVKRAAGSRVPPVRNDSAHAAVGGPIHLCDLAGDNIHFEPPTPDPRPGVFS
jgi:hypothetical protein